MRTHGLFGSDEWWQKIESDKLLVHRLSGVITQLYMGGNHTLLDGHAAGLPATDLLLLTQLLTLDAAGDFLLRPVRISLPDFGQPLRDGDRLERTGRTDGPLSREPVASGRNPRPAQGGALTRCREPKARCQRDAAHLPAQLCCAAEMIRAGANLYHVKDLLGTRRWTRCGILREAQREGLSAKHWPVATRANATKRSLDPPALTGCFSFSRSPSPDTMRLWLNAGSILFRRPLSWRERGLWPFSCPRL